MFFLKNNAIYMLSEFTTEWSQQIIVVECSANFVSLG